MFWIAPAGGGSVRLDEDALPGALLGRLDDGVEMAVGDVGQAIGAPGGVEDLRPFLHVRQAVVEQGEHVGRDLLADPVPRAEILVDPHLHVRASLRKNVTGSYVSGGYATQFNRPFPEKSQLSPERGSGRTFRRVYPRPTSP